MTTVAPGTRRGRTLTTLGPVGQLRAGRLPRRLLQLYVGLVLYGLTLALLIRSGLGNASWDVLHQGVSRHTPLSIGTVIVIVSVLVLLLWVPLREKPGLGTVSNALLVGVAADVGLGLLDHPHAWWLQALMMVGGVLGNGLATALYIGAQLGPGPRDGLMTGLHRRTGLPIGVVRTALEISVVVAGILLGGVFGVGTLLYAVAIGPLVQWLLPWCLVELPGVTASSR